MLSFSKSSGSWTSAASGSKVGTGVASSPKIYVYVLKLRLCDIGMVSQLRRLSLLPVVEYLISQLKYPVMVSA